MEIDFGSRLLFLRFAVIGPGCCTFCRKLLQRFFIPEQILQLYGHRILVQTDCRRNMGIAGAVSHADIVGSRFQNPGRLCLTVRGHGCRRERDGKKLALPRLQQRRFPKAPQLLQRLFQPAARRGAHIDLNHLPACKTGPRIRHLHLRPDAVRICRHIQRFHGKLRIGQPIAKAVKRLYAEGVKITVTHINAFRIILVIHIAVIAAEACGGWIIPIFCRPGVRQLTGRDCFPGQCIRHGIPADISGLAGQKHRADTRNFLQWRCIHHTAYIEHHNTFFISLAQRGQSRQL